MSKVEIPVFTVRVGNGRYGFHGNALAAMNQSDALKAFKKIPEAFVKEAHTKAKAELKRLEAEALKGKNADS